MTGKRRFVGRAPGRLDLMGGNGNYTGGLVLEATTAEGTWATVELREDRQILFFNPQVRDIGWEDAVEYSLDDLSSDDCVRQAGEAAPAIRWTAYVLGAFFLLKQWFPDRITRGANIHIKSEIPMRKGVGSSAALVVALMKTAAFAYGLELAGIELAGACQWLESIIAESACGVMDQTAVVLGEPGRLLPVVCQPCLPQPLVRLPEDLAVWGVHGGGTATGGAEQEAARVATFMGYKLICDWEGLPVHLDEQSQIPRWIDSRWNGYLANVQPSLFRSNYEQRLPETLSGAEYLQLGQTHADPFTQIRPEVAYRVRACTRHAVEENQRVRLFVELARAGAGFEQMGELMYQSHYSYTECGLGCESTDLIVSLVCEEGCACGLYGAKISGGGAVVILGKKDAADALLRVVERFAETQGVVPYLFQGSSMGADSFGVLTVGGEGKASQESKVIWQSSRVFRI
jgi:L-arabinokinase